MDLKMMIKAHAKELGIDKIGFTTADNFAALKPSLLAQKAAGHTTGFEHQNIDERLYPDKIFDQPQSIIAIALAYPAKIHERPPRTGPKRGRFARASWGIVTLCLIEKWRHLSSLSNERRKMILTCVSNLWSIQVN